MTETPSLPRAEAFLSSFPRKRESIAPQAQQTPLAMLTAQFLAWLAARPRSYAETMDAWRSTCPRLSVWEDALGDGLVALQSGEGGMRETRVVLTQRGRQSLAAAEDITTFATERRA